jgi:acyl-CoA reductase-like NAD-dependent aldehyde dehydrogenase
MTEKLLINGAQVAAQADRTFDRTDPILGTLATRASAMSQTDARRAISAAKQAFGAWSRTGPEVRRALLSAAADAMQARSAEFVDAMIAETGATRMWAGFNVHLATGVLREAAALTSQLTGDVIPTNKPGTFAMGVYKPHGVCLAIAPWNAPVILGTRAVATAIACGNTVVLKSSEMCPRTHGLIGQCFVDAGFPAGVLNVVHNAPEDAAQLVAAMIADADIRHVNFTGSSTVGRVIGRLAGENLKPALLELGGKAPLVVLSDADIDGAVNAAIFGSFMNQGQICMSTERIIVEDAIADDFVRKLAARASLLVADDPRNNPVLGAMITELAAERMDALIADAVEKGALVVAGGSRRGAVVQATLLDHVSSTMRIYHEESFGPVKSVIRVADEYTAIRCANDTEYGLSSAVFSQDITRAMRVAGQIEAGICHINGSTVSDEPQMPFGGVKASGFGRFGGRAGIGEFCHLQWLNIEDPQQHYPF